MKMNIVVCGHDAAGKSCLIEAARQAAKQIGEESLNFIEAPAPEPGQPPGDYAALVEKLALGTPQEGEMGETFVCRWFCLAAANGDQDFDLEFMEAAGSKCLLVVTTADPLDVEQLADLLIKLGRRVPAERIVAVSATKGVGLPKLLHQSFILVAQDTPAPEAAPQSAAADSDQLAEEDPDQLILWAVGRAFAIAAVPLPLADVAPLAANEAYMIYRLGCCYGYSLSESTIANFIGCIGASLVGKFVASFIPFLKAPIAAAVTYAVGMTAKEYFASGMSLEPDDLRRKFKSFEETARSFKWQ